MCPTTKFIIPLWPTYYMPNNTTCTFSPTALKFYNKYPSITTKHLHSLHIITHNNIKLTFPSIPTKIKSNLLDYHQFHVVKPSSQQTLPSHLQDPSYINALPTVTTENLISCAVRKPYLASQNNLSHPTMQNAPYA